MPTVCQALCLLTLSMACSFYPQSGSARSASLAWFYTWENWGLRIVWFAHSQTARRLASKPLSVGLFDFPAPHISASYCPAFLMELGLLSPRPGALLHCSIKGTIAVAGPAEAWRFSPGSLHAYLIRTMYQEWWPKEHFYKKFLSSLSRLREMMGVAQDRPTRKWQSQG